MTRHDDDMMVDEIVPGSGDNNDDDESNGNGHSLPDALRPDATTRAVVIAVNTLALEVQLTRKSISSLGTRVEMTKISLEERFDALEVLLKRILARKSGE